MQTGKFSLTLGVVILSLYFSSAQLLPVALSLECLGENKASVLLHLTNTSCPAQGPIYLLPHTQFCSCITSACFLGFDFPIKQSFSGSIFPALFDSSHRNYTLRAQYVTNSKWNKPKGKVPLGSLLSTGKMLSLDHYGSRKVALNQSVGWLLISTFIPYLCNDSCLN